MKYPSIRIEGTILSADILDRLSNEDIPGQKAKDFGLTHKNARVKDEIVRAWADAQDLWRIFISRMERVPENRTGTSETRSFWMVPLLQILGYDPQYDSTARTVNNQSYAISHKAVGIDDFPIHIMGFKDSLDKKRTDSGPRMSPHSLVQEYINLTEHLYALVSNGLQLRLLRDSSRLIRLSYLEFDLERMFSEDHYNDFALMYRLIHQSRMPKSQADAAESLMEQYHQDSLDAGARIREGLFDAVKASILELGRGFLKHPDNHELRQALRDNLIDPQTYYQYLLRLIYRFLFLMVTEERDLIFTKDVPINQRTIYDNYYSLNKLRKMAEKRWLADKRYNDLWIGLKSTFQLFEREPDGRPLGVKPLAGDLFSPGAIDYLNGCQLDNATLLNCFRRLSMFEHPDTHQIIRVNYASLNVEEFGSVYEGMLKFNPVITLDKGRRSFQLQKGNDITQSHYTPEDLVLPLIKHSVDYVIEEKLKASDPESALLSIKVCDITCGSGHFLLGAARRIATELAKVRTGEDQPSPEAYRQALRHVIRHCIYGVDKNPLAVELTKVALWLEAHNPGKPLNFLDHHIRCGDSIVGLAHPDELERGIPEVAYKTLSGDDKTTIGNLRKQLKRERKSPQMGFDFRKFVIQPVNIIEQRFHQIDALPESTPLEVERKGAAYNRLRGNEAQRLTRLANLQTAQFFIPKNQDNLSELITEDEFRKMLIGALPVQGQTVAKADAEAHIGRFFHWFLEFPDVFAEKGFDAIVGNPPFLGGQSLSGTFGNRFLEYLKYHYAPIGAVDLVTYFFRRAYTLIKPSGFMALIATNTIAQGDAREDGLKVITQDQQGSIHFALRSMRWPGVAAVEVAMVGIHRGPWKKTCTLDGKSVDQISTYLDDSDDLGDPFPLKANQNQSFQGSIVLGKGFVLEPQQAQALMERNPRNKDVLFPYLNGEDLNSRPDQSPSRWVINFFDWPLRRYTEDEWADLPQDEQQELLAKLEQGRTIEVAPPDYEKPVAADYPDCLEIVERDVKPERQRWKQDKGGNGIVGEYALRKPLPERWWHYAEKRPALYRTIAPLERVLVVARISRTLAFLFISKNNVFADAIVVLAIDNSSHLCILMSTIHNLWSWQYCTTMKTDLNYTPGKTFETFPFPTDLSPEQKSRLNTIGESYHTQRSGLMLNSNLGLTKLYNQFHNPGLEQALSDGETVPDGSLSPTDRQALTKKYGKETVAILQHLAKGDAPIGFSDFVKRVVELRALHKEMDEAVLEAYGWHIESESGPTIELAHDFYEVDYLPENDRVRYTISPKARKEVLKRLLLLNHQRHAEEVAADDFKKQSRVHESATPYSKSRSVRQEYLMSNNGFTIGQKLEHPTLGIGTLTEIDGTGGSETLTIDFNGTIRRILSNMVNLQAVDP